MNKYIAILCLGWLIGTAHKPFSSLVAHAPADTTSVGICHKTGNGWVYKLVKEQSVNGHFAHGDFLYKGRPDVYDFERDDWCVLNAEENK